MANRLTPKLEPYEHQSWRAEVSTYYPDAFIQDDSSSSGLRERALFGGQLVGFFMRPHVTGKGQAYVIHPELHG